MKGQKSRFMLKFNVRSYVTEMIKIPRISINLTHDFMEINYCMRQRRINNTSDTDIIKIANQNVRNKQVFKKIRS
jgi:hypothetical protein